LKKLNLNAIRIDGGTQSRVEINNEAVSDYAEAVKVGIEFPPVIVFHDGADHWLADGFHRFHAHKQAGKASIQADVRDGTVRDAILYSLGANCTHGLRRSNADKRKAVGAMLADAEWAKWSDRKIAEACGVSQPFVSGMRKPPEVITVITPKTEKPAREVVTVTTFEPKKEVLKSSATREAAPPPPADTDQLSEAQHTISELAEENETLRDKLAVESLMDSEEAKTQTAETIRDLRALVKTLEAENAALKVSRDTYQREASEAKKSALYWRKQAEKAAKDAA
jgi:ParB-like nuclease domain.